MGVHSRVNVSNSAVASLPACRPALEQIPCCQPEPHAEQPSRALPHSPHVASWVSSGLQQRNATGPVCPRSTCCRTSVLPPGAALLPLLLSPLLPPLPLLPPPPAALLLLLRCTSQMMAVWSLPQEASMRPSCENCRCHTSSEWSSSTCRGGAGAAQGQRMGRG